MADERKPQVKEEKPVLRVGLFTAWMASTGLLLVLVVLVAAWSLQQIEGRARSRAREDAIHRIETIRNRVQEEAAARPGATIEELVRSTRWVTAVLNRQASTGEHIEWIAIVSPAGVVLARSGAGEFARDSSLRPSDSLPSPGESTPPAGVALTKDEVIRYAVPVTLAGRELGTVQIGLSSRGLDAAVTELLRPVWRSSSWVVFAWPYCFSGEW
jgi:hypothetical protein